MGNLPVKWEILYWEVPTRKSLTALKYKKAIIAKLAGSPYFYGGKVHYEEPTVFVSFDKTVRVSIQELDIWTTLI